MIIRRYDVDIEKFVDIECRIDRGMSLNRRISKIQNNYFRCQFSNNVDRPIESQIISLAESCIRTKKKTQNATSSITTCYVLSETASIYTVNSR